MTNTMMIALIVLTVIAVLFLALALVFAALNIYEERLISQGRLLDSRPAWLEKAMDIFCI